MVSLIVIQTFVATGALGAPHPSAALTTNAALGCGGPRGVLQRRHQDYIRVGRD